jgi:hypothetical protein
MKNAGCPHEAPGSRFRFRDRGTCEAKEQALTHTTHDSTANSRSELNSTETFGTGFSPAFNPNPCTSKEITRQEAALLTELTPEQSPQGRHFVVCSVCKKERLVSRCFGNAFGIVCGDCLAVSGDIKE